ncbi:hypothetical protein EDD17DRAFT_498911 [Pisolithus thermaeus]|nr:hypothetical protein EDD17DRAFT_498911 [Pisolithus thermaeus]
MATLLPFAFFSPIYVASILRQFCTKLASYCKTVPPDALHASSQAALPSSPLGIHINRPPNNRMLRFVYDSCSIRWPHDSEGYVGFESSASGEPPLQRPSAYF